jgi:hypothetical protein
MCAETIPISICNWNRGCAPAIPKAIIVMTIWHQTIQRVLHASFLLNEEPVGRRHMIVLVEFKTSHGVVPWETECIEFC